MTKNLPAPALPGLVADLEGADVVSRHASKINTEFGKDTLPELPGKADRTAIERRISALQTKLRPVSMAVAEQDRVIAELGAVWLGYPSMRNADVAAMSTAYLLDLQDLPLFAILAACEDIRRRRIKNLDPDWPPTSPRIHDIAARHVEPIAVAVLQAKRVLAVRDVRRPVTEAMQAKVGALVNDFAAASRLRLEQDHEERRAEYGRRYIGPFGQKCLEREWAKEGVRPQTTGGANPVMISPSLASQLGSLRKTEGRR
jgi:hypothetical protein